MDSDTTTSLSLSCPQSEIMKKEVFLFEYLHNRGSLSSSLGFMKCVVLLRPEKVKVNVLIRHSYRHFILTQGTVLFSGTCPGLQGLAKFSG